MTNVAVGQVWYCNEGSGTRYIEITGVVPGQSVRYTTYAKWAWPDRKRYPTDSTMKTQSLIASYKLATSIQVATLLRRQPVTGTKTAGAPPYDAARHVAAEMISINKKLGVIGQNQAQFRADFANTMKRLHDKQNRLEEKLDSLLESLGG
tara:strand:- start:90619 stop:91068 length:450 start_codon:yes stop_codon:yes gene_type:complete